MDLLPRRPPPRRGWWDFAPANTLTRLGALLLALAVGWGALALLLGFNRGYVLEFAVMGGLGGVYLVAGLLGRAEERRARQRPGRQRHRGHRGRRGSLHSGTSGRGAESVEGPVGGRDLAPV